MSRTVHTINSRLSLRQPQRESLEILHRVMELANPRELRDTEKLLQLVQNEFHGVEDFERSFPSLCFALATGVGKTRLMGAFIAYLHREHGVQNFFVLAPNLTIYKKLLDDFSPTNPKYVFPGIAEFATRPPLIVTGDNFREQTQIDKITSRRDLITPVDVVVNIFNIAKFNTRSKEARKTWSFSEFLGQSYFDHLAAQDDLVLIMDEAHRYRADTSMKSLEALQPMLGLELTATPQIEAGKKSTPFRNVIYNYPLANAMRDGFVKEPAVATRLDFKASDMSPEQLEQLKLEDGVRVHEATKVELDLYARQNGLPIVKPFMLVIATDTEHAKRLVTSIEDDSFFGGRYKGRVIQVHSGQRGAEKDENIERLLAVERANEPTEIVIHVNMLKEGWDVTNLYTIVPLRKADSRTLVEQSIGRGLRLPYGKRTGVAEVDRLTIIAHDKFQDIVDEAKGGGYSFSVVNVGEDIPETPKQSVVVDPVVDTLLGGGQATEPQTPEDTTSPDPSPPAATMPAAFVEPEEQAVAKCTLKAIRKMTRSAKIVPSPAALQGEETQQELVKEVTKQLGSEAPSLYPQIDEAKLTSVVSEATALYLKHTIAIPRVIVLPTGKVEAGFNEFELDLSALRLQPVPEEILVMELTTDEQQIIGGLEGGVGLEERLEDYVVRGLIDFDDVNYDEQSDLIYGLANQVVTHLQSYLDEEKELRNVLIYHQKPIANLVHEQMQEHSWERATSYEATVSSGFTEIAAQAFGADGNEKERPFDKPIKHAQDIRKMIFGGFQRCLYPRQKFDSDPERRFAVILERDNSVLRWFKPGRKAVQIRYSHDHDYEPDFVIETADAKLLAETKRADQLQDPTVLAKAEAAATWCRHATEHELKHDGKPWRYLLIPHDAVAENMTLKGLVAAHEFLETQGESQ
ncbi:MAG: type III restriction endonuclease subunit R [Planctomycetota bacterium]|nr:MAG: type III restriction endonuclease subunit R [Planctomycetota bacterium]